MKSSSTRRNAYVKMYSGSGVSTMEVLYWKLQKRWAKKFAKVKKVNMCKKGGKQYVTV